MYRSTKAKEDGDLDMSIGDLMYALRHVNQGEVVDATQYKDGGQRIKIAISVDDGKMILVELASKSAGTLRLKTGWKVTNEKFEKKIKSRSNTTGNRSSTNAVRDDTASNDIVSDTSKNAIHEMKLSLAGVDALTADNDA